jgi:hypothetical protein
MSDLTDEQFFAQHPDRQARIRKPAKSIDIDRKTRRTRVRDEEEDSFESLGYHVKDRRRILLYRVPRDNYFFDPDRPQILKIPFLLFSDEAVEDNDETLLPLIHEIMDGELKKNWRA